MPVSLALAAALHFAVYFWGSSYEQSKKRLDSANAPYRRPAAAEIVDSSSFLVAKVTILGAVTVTLAFSVTGSGQSAVGRARSFNHVNAEEKCSGSASRAFTTMFGRARRAGKPVTVIRVIIDQPPSLPGSRAWNFSTQMSSTVPSKKIGHGGNNLFTP